jgi:Type IV secretion system pilin
MNRATALVYVSLVSSLGMVAIARAGQGGDPDAPVTLHQPFPGDSLITIIDKVSSALIVIATPVVALMVLVGGFQIMTAGGNEEKVKSGKDTIMNAVIGFAIILLAKGAAKIVISLVSGSPSTPTH